jgi:hypothetical protein
MGHPEGRGNEKEHTLNTMARSTMGKYLGEQGMSGARRGEGRIEAYERLSLRIDIIKRRAHSTG